MQSGDGPSAKNPIEEAIRELDFRAAGGRPPHACGQTAMAVLRKNSIVELKRQFPIYTRDAGHAGMSPSM
jgi:hypothetical protein